MLLLHHTERVIHFVGKAVINNCGDAGFGKLTDYLLLLTVIININNSSAGNTLSCLLHYHLKADLLRMIVEIINQMKTWKTVSQITKLQQFSSD